MSLLIFENKAGALRRDPENLVLQLCTAEGVFAFPTPTPRIPGIWESQGLTQQLPFYSAPPVFLSLTSQPTQREGRAGSMCERTKTRLEKHNRKGERGLASEQSVKEMNQGRMG